VEAAVDAVAVAVKPFLFLEATFLNGEFLSALLETAPPPRRTSNSGNMDEDETGDEAAAVASNGPVENRDMAVAVVTGVVSHDGGMLGALPVMILPLELALLLSRGHEGEGAEKGEAWATPNNMLVVGSSSCLEDDGGDDDDDR
jgi:hypothetical protein